MQPNRRVTVPEVACLTVFLGWLMWLPLPFGSVIEKARLPLLAPSFALCLVACALRLLATRARVDLPRPTRASVIWILGGALFLVIGLLQLVPLTPSVLGAISPESLAIWTGAAHVASLAGATVRSSFPISIDPGATQLELLRGASLLAVFTTSALLIRTHARRRALATALCLIASFEALYGLRQGALGNYEIWNWANWLIFNRVTGTFVNPNHFGHYLAILLPMALFLAAVQWRDAGPEDVPVGRRVMRLLEHGVLGTIFAVIVIVTVVAGLLVSQSRGAMLAGGVGLMVGLALLPGRRKTRLVFAVLAAVILVAALAMFLGPERTLKRFIPTEVERNALSGRPIAMRAGLELFHRFPLFGSGLGTFDRVVGMTQTTGLDLTYHHAHNDYIEVAATAGTLGLVIGVVTLLGGFGWLVRITVGSNAHSLTWRRRAFQLAVLASLTTAMVHALFDFNLFIPANPATLAAMVGAAVASVDHDIRSRR